MEFHLFLENLKKNDQKQQNKNPRIQIKTKEFNQNLQEKQKKNA